MAKKTDVGKIVDVILAGVSMAMGVACIVLGFFGTEIQTLVTLLSIGVASGGLYLLNLAAK